MWVKVSIAALVIALLGGAMYYLDNEEALTKERRECASRYKNLNGLRGEFTEEKTKYVDFLVKNNAALRQLKADQDARLSPPNLKTRVSQVIHDFNVVVIDGGAADLGVVPGSKLAVMRDGNKIAELDVNAVESRVSTATILPSTVTAGERVEAGDVVVSVRP